MKFKELPMYKTEIINRLLESQKICKALFYAHENFLEQPDIDDTSELVYTKIFPHTFVPDLDNNKASYITITLRNFRGIDSNYKHGEIRFNIVVHKELHRTNYGATRMDYLIGEVDELFNSTRGLGIGKLQFSGLDEFGINDQYVGYYLTYRPVDRN